MKSEPWILLVRTLGAMVALAACIMAFTPAVPALGQYVAARTAVLQPTDRAGAIVVLAHAVSSRGALSDESAARAYRGIELLQRGAAPLLVFSGKNPASALSEADVRGELARGRGVDATAVLQLGGDNTAAEARNGWRLLAPRGVSDIFLVTDPVHMLRARVAFERAGFSVHAAPSPATRDDGVPSQRVAMVVDLLADLVGYALYRLMGVA